MPTASPHTLSGLSDGAHTFRVRAIDLAGNVETNAAAHIWTVDTVPPVASISAPSATAARPGDSVTFTVTYAGADIVTLSSADVLVNASGTATATASVSGDGVGLRTVTLANLAGEGRLGVSLAADTARDLAGNLAPAAGSSATFQMTERPPEMALAYEGFDYPAGTDLSGQSGGEGWVTAWSTAPGDTATAVSVSYADSQGNQLVTAGNRGFYTGQGGTSQPFREFATAGAGRGTDGTTTWISLLIQRSGPTVEGDNIYPRGANVAFFDGATERFGIGNPSGALDNFISIIPSGTLENRRPASTSFSELSFAVLRIDHLPGNDNAWLFINPRLDMEPDISTVAAQTLGEFNFTFNRVRPFAGNPQTGRPYAELTLDELRIGETYADVAPHFAAPTIAFDITDARLIAPGLLRLGWPSLSGSHRYTVEQTSGLPAGWEPAPGTNEWPVLATEVVLPISGAQKFLRVKAQPGN